MKKRKLMFIVPSLQGGGAERVILTLLQYLPREKFELNLVLVEKVGPYLQAIPADVPVFDLQAPRVRYAIVKLVSLINEQRPDVVLSTLGHLNMALLMVRPLLPTHTRLIVRESNTVSSRLANNSGARIWTWLYRKFYGKADLIVCQSNYMAQDLVEEFKIPFKKTKIIYNPVDDRCVRDQGLGENPFAPNGKCNLIFVGRLTKNKAVHRIVEALPALIAKKSAAELWIIGVGPLEVELRELCRKLHIEDRVHWVGFQDNPCAWMAHADLLVLSSLYEGLPNVVLEAIASGCPVISTDHPGGTREIMALIGEPERMVSSLTWEDWWFDRPSTAVLSKLQENFGLDSIVSQYADILTSI